MIARCRVRTRLVSANGTISDGRQHAGRKQEDESFPVGTECVKMMMTELEQGKVCWLAVPGFVARRSCLPLQSVDGSVLEGLPVETVEGCAAFAGDLVDEAGLLDEVDLLDAFPEVPFVDFRTENRLVDVLQLCESEQFRQQAEADGCLVEQLAELAQSHLHHGDVVAV